MLWSKFFIPTVKETPADAVVPSHQLGIRAGLVRQVASGSYAYLPLGYRVLRKIENIVREEINAAGGIELHMPAMHPKTLWEQTGRVEAMGDVLLQLKGRDWQSGIVLGPTHEEIITEIARAYINSYKQLPINLYQIQTKFRGEERPKSGILRTREFLMKDAYSFHSNLDSLDQTYRKMYDTYCRIFTRCGLPFIAVEAESGPIGGNASHEFMVLTDAGEDIVAISEDRKYAANIEKAARQISEPPSDPDPSAMKTLEKVHTPDVPGIDDRSARPRKRPGAGREAHKWLFSRPDHQLDGLEIVPCGRHFRRFGSAGGQRALLRNFVVGPAPPDGRRRGVVVQQGAVVGPVVIGHFDNGRQCERLQVGGRERHAQLVRSSGHGRQFQAELGALLGVQWRGGCRRGHFVTIGFPDNSAQGCHEVAVPGPACQNP